MGELAAADRSTGLGLCLEHQDAPPGVGEHVGGDETVGTGPDHDCIDVAHRVDRTRVRFPGRSSGPGMIQPCSPVPRSSSRGSGWSSRAAWSCATSTWTAARDERWVVLGPNGSGQDLDPPAPLVPARAVERVGHRPRRPLRHRRRADGPSAHRAGEQCGPPAPPADAHRPRRRGDRRRRRPRAVVEHLLRRRPRARRRPARVGRVRRPRRSGAGHPLRGRAQAGARRPAPHGRPRAPPVRRAVRRPRPRRTRVAGGGAGRAGAGGATARDGHPPPRGDPARLHPRAAPACGRGGRGRPDLGDAVVGRGLRHLRGRGHVDSDGTRWSARVTAR